MVRQTGIRQGACILIVRSFGKGEGLSTAERREKYPDGIFPEMESYEALIERACAAFEKMVTAFKDKQNILMVAHGAILYAILTAITDGQIVYGGKTVKLDPASIHVIRYFDGAIKLAKYSNEEAAFMDILF